MESLELALFCVLNVGMQSVSIYECHYQIAYSFDKIYKIIKKVGYNRIVYFKNRKKHFIDI